MPIYAWKNKRTGEITEVMRPMSECNTPPDWTNEWERVYSFGLGRVEGAGGSPGRVSVRRDA